MWKRLMIAVASLGLANCATLSEEECMIGDWRTIGYQDGAEGHASDRIGSHSEACARYGVSPELDAWTQGYNQGLQTYCTPHNGLRVGATGATYNNVCSGPNGQGFVAAYNDGRQYYEASRRLDQANSDLYSSRNRIEDLRRDLRRARADSRNPDLTDDERDAAVAAIERISRQIGREESEIRNIERALYDLERDADNIRSFLYNRYPGASGW